MKVSKLGACNWLARYLKKERKKGIMMKYYSIVFAIVTVYCWESTSAVLAKHGAVELVANHDQIMKAKISSTTSSIDHRSNSSPAKSKTKQPQLAVGPRPTKISNNSNNNYQQQQQLSATYYLTSCPNLEGIIQQKVNAWIRRDSTMAASIIRLHFHDCAVRGCDASILLNHAGSERRAMASRTLRGFELMDEIKAEVEKTCPKTVSCADILTAAARDATVAAGGPFWEVPFGRKDGRVSLAKEADSIVPQGHENVTALIDFFQARGLNVLDLVILSGSHTIGRSSCFSIQQRLSSASNHDDDPSIDLKYLNSLRRQCRSNSSSNYVYLDATTPRTFDEVYYTNLEKNRGLLLTDQLLFSDSRTAPFVAALTSQPALFFNQFAVSMIKLANVQLLMTATDTNQVRLNCNYVN